ncbi:Bifunctional hemolysin/adenylate cyclase precursor [Aquimixticola soesokkakensis]|uniref:Bifunctional hemolysin/adenylate cyclase n=1 Tax=Aquimixticola soesokkakensis TaxID=1519096 RepID=A0A1Y5SCQ5_9RHOB|nr:Hint domain-containing protein [Aquimixticola soesokkakensis]SLN34940.1 Bifunctional hemolysin/adenylate cyclase precursor [Aquimixticola soesokkakensis]
MPTYNVNIYDVNPATLFGTSSGSTAVYSGAAALGSAVITDNQTGTNGTGLDDDSRGENATATVTMNGTTTTNSVQAERVWTVTDTATGETFQVVQFTVGSGWGARNYTLSEQPLIAGHEYEVVSYSNDPDMGTSNDGFSYADYSDGVVTGSAGNDVIDKNYTGDTQGDQIDSVSESDVMFHWSNANGSNGSYSDDVGGVTVTATVTNDGRMTGNQINTSTAQYVANGETYGTNSSLNVTGNGNGNTATIVIDFETADGSQANSEVENVSFRLNDVDSGSFSDVLSVTAFDAEGNALAVTLTAGGSDTVNGNTVTGNGGLNDPDQLAGSVLVEIDGAVSYIVIDYNNGGSGAQTVYVSDIAFTSIYESFDDVVNAGDGDDFIDPGLGDDIVNAGAGNDTIMGGQGADTMHGGTGQDTIDYSNSASGVNVDLGAGTFSGGDAEGDSGTGIDGLIGSDYDDTLIGFDGESKATDGSGYTNIFYGGAGNDYLDGKGGDDQLYGGDGNDQIYGGTGNDYIEGGAGDDWIMFGEGADVVYGGDGNDTIDDAPGVDTGDYEDFVDAGAGDDVVFTGGGGDTIYGGTGNDQLHGEDGDDLIYGGADDDRIWGDGGNDTIYGDSGNDIIDAGDGDDIVYGGEGDDLIGGGSGNDTIYGGDGNDGMSGGAGYDTLDGGAGDDQMLVGSGDTATGGAGNDIFYIDGDTLDGATINIYGGEEDETSGDVLNFNGTLAGPVTYTSEDTITPGRSGYATLIDGTVVNFSNIESVICFTAGTRIATPFGPRPIEDLVIGDLVLTRDHGPQPLRWIGSRSLTATAALAPIEIAQGTLGNARVLRVSPEHRMLVTGWRAELLFGEPEVFVAAKHLINDANVRPCHGGEVTYLHMMFDQHEVVFAEGAAAESFHPGGMAMDTLDEMERAEFFSIFPELRALPNSHGPLARRCLKRHEAALLA